MSDLNYNPTQQHLTPRGYLSFKDGLFLVRPPGHQQSIQVVPCYDAVESLMGGDYLWSDEAAEVSMMLVHQRILKEKEEEEVSNNQHVKAPKPVPPKYPILSPELLAQLGSEDVAGILYFISLNTPSNVFPEALQSLHFGMGVELTVSKNPPDDGERYSEKEQFDAAEIVTEAQMDGMELLMTLDKRFNGHTGKVMGALSGIFRMMALAEAIRKETPVEEEEDSK